MTRIVLANSDYTPGPGCGHMTDEGHQLQQGLAHAGWTLCGPGFDGLRDVPAILARYKPSAVFVQDARDWDPASRISFRKDIGFERIEALAEFPGLVATVVKDAGTSIDYQHEMCAGMGVDAVAVYYHPQSVTACAPWLRNMRLVRIHHSIDIESLPAEIAFGQRQAVVSGAVSDTYPLRRFVRDHADKIGCDVLKHPGYGNRGCSTPAYLGELARYKCHIATASRFGFALRKIIESVAVGCIPITDLPHYDKLPWIDGALHRLNRPYGGIEYWQDAIDGAELDWDRERRTAWALGAWRYYDWRAAGKRLDRKLRRIEEEMRDGQQGPTGN